LSVTGDCGDGLRMKMIDCAVRLALQPKQLPVGIAEVRTPGVPGVTGPDEAR
jgi:hypothetical protein